MTFFKYLVASTALFNVALSSTYYSAAPPCVTSVETVTHTSIELTSNSFCKTVTTVVTPTVTVTLQSPGGTEGASTAVSSAADTTDVAPTTSIGSVSSTSTSDSGNMTIYPIGPPTPVEPSVPMTSKIQVSMIVPTSHFHIITANGTANSTGFPSTIVSPTMSVPYPLNSTTAAPATSTGVASASESASASYTVPPEFTAAAGAVNMATAALFGGALMAVFGI
ncbi:hypothetical protein PtrSN002B_006915 [Pyrenophora tritici-repentis]|uniref:Herpes-BLLF1 multi-domain protein n=2 Tax=Pyrenophora tritici-repentis TaxID=45151 RepID=A0A2W1DSJ3_9PLEO|nr:uncharacterized protein PTRG_05240 [Pyrenophora tritici-repentis Pt-1C-BFP]KAA8611588.1 hypothetical protein PtrV1_13464 [Pyrenophora tritici-repentis]EDU48147.1 predicted protein [Pyrenophora tritici-repentis Pt-1C-BFP]KAF7569883.1 Herpes-BLLF1 multi-domain protein [Pyrenophora tritici-repentis]KAG9382394.1 hypothetical protein A1F94_006315 [Pyrenophora tritici-repentis]KAI0576511.1 hypothetical protein Alg215_07441 [Pyrenophora tritici-repentis]